MLEAVNPVPVMVTGVPPALGPELGLRDVTVGWAQHAGVVEELSEKFPERCVRLVWGATANGGLSTAMGREQGRSS